MAITSASRRRRRRPGKLSSRSSRNSTSRKKGRCAKKSRKTQTTVGAKRRGIKPRLTNQEYVMVPVSRIDPSPWGTRLVYAEIEELADSIRGDGETEGIGIVEPVLVRQTARGRFELLDGARRWKAAKLVAEERDDPDFLVPARIFDVPDRIAMLIAAAADTEHDRRKPLEMALLYQSLREALELERGQKVGIRTIAGIGWHKRSMVRDYLAIGRAITRDMLRRAGILDGDGRADEVVVVKLSVNDLLAVAGVPTVAGRIAALRARADHLRGIKPAGAASDTPAGPVSPEERLAQMRDGGLSIRVRAPIRTLAPAAASELVATELTPAILAVVDQAQGGVGGAGYFAEFTDDRTVLVLPREVEALSAAQLGTLAEHVDRLRKRVRRAIRFRSST